MTTAETTHPFEKPLIVFCGSGGVGKTTVSAAVALGLALQGKKVLVMTIDPARRLMDSLGIKPQLDKDVSVADLSAFPDRKEGGELHACMLETKRHMDQVVERLSPNRETFEKIMENRIYQVIADNFSGSQETIALVKLYEFTLEDYDHIVVDTAPHRYAVEFFETPSRLTDFLDPKVFKWFSMPVETLQNYGSRFFKKGAEIVFNQVEKAIGLTFVSEITTLLGLFEGLTESFRERSEDMRNQLKTAEKTSFNVVASPNAFSASDGAYLMEKIEELHFPSGAVIFNRVHEIPGFDKEDRFHVEISGSEGDDGTTLAQRLVHGYEQSLAISRREQKLISEFTAKYDVSPVKVPFFPRDVTELQSLVLLEQHLFGRSTPDAATTLP